MAEMLRITIPVDCHLASPNQRGHWAKLAKVRKQFKELSRALWMQAGRPRAAHPVRVSFLVRRPRKIDNDNALASMKPIIDGLFKQAITPDDSAKWVQIGDVAQETGKKWLHHEEVVVIVEKAA